MWLPDCKPIPKLNATAIRLRVVKPLGFPSGTAEDGDMTTMVIRPGDAVIVSSATGDLRRRAVTGPVPGQDFTVVWLCSEEEWFAASEAGREPHAVPWPVEDVQLLSDP